MRVKSGFADGPLPFDAPLLFAIVGLADVGLLLGLPPGVLLGGRPTGPANFDLPPPRLAFARILALADFARSLVSAREADRAFVPTLLGGEDAFEPVFGADALLAVGVLFVAFGLP